MQRDARDAHHAPSTAAQPQEQNPKVGTEAHVPTPPSNPTKPSLASNVSAIQKKGGRLLSLLLAINVLLIGCAVVSSGGLEMVDIHETEVFILLTVLIFLAIIWMLFQLYFTAKNRDSILYKDSHAGPIWLRAGLVFFALFTLVQDIFRIGHFITFHNCESPIKIIYPVMQASFVIIQTYFLWVSCKQCVQIHTNITRYGLMLVLITNLLVWISAVTDESIHQMEEHKHQAFNTKRTNHSMEGNHTEEDQSGTRSLRGAGGPGEVCFCNSTLCAIFQEGYNYMYPFIIEYSLFASTLTYIMWRNVGRFIDDNVQHPCRLKLCFCMQTFFVGIGLGLAVLLVGLLAFIFYKVKADSANNEGLIMLYIFNICGLSVMSLVCLMGSILYRYDKRDMVNHKNPSRTLDVTLLLGAALGQYCISHFSIVALVARRPEGLLSVLNLISSLLVIFQHSVQNIFIIEGLHKEPYEDTMHNDGQDPPGLFYANTPVLSHSRDGDGSSLPVRSSQALDTPAMPGTQISEASLSAPLKKTHWKRKILREILLCLLLCNVIFWIIPAFGARPQLRHNLEQKFYGEYMWDLIVNVCLPFGIFYRLHSVASLMEVYMKM